MSLPLVNNITTEVNSFDALVKEYTKHGWVKAILLKVQQSEYSQQLSSLNNFVADTKGRLHTAEKNQRVMSATFSDQAIKSKKC